MASSSTNTPKTTPFTTPRKIGSIRTPRSHQKVQSTVQTPEISNTGTPILAQIKRRSSEKYDQISNLTVAVRVRPMNAKELSCPTAVNCVSVRDNQLIITSKQAASTTVNIDHIFQYDHIFWSCDETTPLYASQEDVFYTIGIPLLNSAFRGYNACLFAYGQTGSGKSFSMMGRNTTETIDIDSEEHSGIVPRFCRHLFERIAKLQPDSVTVEVCYFEIYNEKIHDLLATNQIPLKVREHPEWGPYVVDLTVHPVKSFTELRNWLLIGNQNRATAATNMNKHSSRSHSIFAIELCLNDDDNNSRRSRVSLVDLAGSERLNGGHNTDEKIRQGVCINKSLLTLGKVISSLADSKKNQFIPYRDSVLTWLLKESLGGNSLTSMLATITPSNTNLDETLATLRYACQARSIVNRARINENPHDRVIRELKQEVERLKALKQDYERNSFTLNNSSSPSSLIRLDDDCKTQQELEELRSKLQVAESKLLTAEGNWRQRFFENAQNLLKELAESEKRREELESRVRILKTIDDNCSDVDISVYKTNFLQELEDVLTVQHCETSDFERIIDWCFENKLKCIQTETLLTIIDNNKQTFLLLKDVGRLKNFENIADFIASLTWTEIKKLNKSEVLANFSQIYQALNNLKLNIDDENGSLNLMLAKVNKSLQSFETAMLHTVTKNSKNVTFKV